MSLFAQYGAAPTIAAAQFGQVPAADTREIAGIVLPPGQLVHSDPAFGGGPQPYAWISSEPVPEEYRAAVWGALVAVFPRTGLWPVWAEGFAGDLERPWHGGELGVHENPVAKTAEQVYRRWEGGPYDDPDADPETRFTRLTDAVAGPVTWPERMPYGDRALMLVPVLRPADIPARLGWTGPVNHDLGCGQVSAVLRSWEDRFGAYVIGIGFDTLELHVSRIPGADDQVRLLAIEHYTFCPDNIDQGIPLEEYRDLALPESNWHFWWD